MKKTALILSPLLAAGFYLLAGHASDAASYLTSRQMVTTGTVSQVPSATATNGTADGVARVDHEHTCATASSSQAGCLSATDWSTFNGKAEPYIFTHGLYEWPAGSVGCTTDCDSSSGQPCCLTSLYDGTTGGQVIPGVKKWSGDAWFATIKGYLNLRIYTGGGTLTLDPKYDGILRLAHADSIRASSTTSYELGLEVPTPSNATTSRVVVRNSGGLETTWRTDFDVQAGDIDIEDGDLRLAGTVRIERDGDATFASVSASSGSLPASAITSGTLGVSRGGTGLSSATGDAVMVGSGSAWEAKVIPDCDATGGRLQYDQATNAFSCATRESWTTVSTFTNSWDDCATPPRYLKDSDGRVHLSGCVYNGTAGSSAFTLPSGYRPAATRGFAVATGTGADATCFLQVGTTGAVTPRSACSNAAVYLDGVSFFTD